ncbi:hypothetical protein RDV89_00875 [Nocardioides zeae]|uniref:Uncharacterized protein n=1 Tax=Nocardioides imazamoxiresistens TaxID=3231893 RepID=A0ABU3PQV7_9ACTN|nr:hypothetical protein [Nocardioides zeae]MDT9591599.1 hypothetical protein [Nocardioides zeae]
MSTLHACSARPSPKHLAAEAVTRGAPGWLNLLVLVLAWDAIKIGLLAIAVLLRWVGLAARGTVGRRNDRRPAASYS